MSRACAAAAGVFCSMVMSAMAQVSQPNSASSLQPLRILLVGDSTMATKNGYGDALCAALDPARVTCVNLAKNGRSSGSFRAEGLWDGALSSMRDAKAQGQLATVLIQFGHNDQPGKPGRSTDLATEFPVNMARYVAEARAAGAVPVLVTPLSRRSFKDGKHHNDLVPWAEATRKVAGEMKTELIDLNTLSAAAIVTMGSEEADSLAEAPKPTHPAKDGEPKSKFDYTHLGPKGAAVFSKIVLTAWQLERPDLARYLKQ